MKTNLSLVLSLCGVIWGFAGCNRSGVAIVYPIESLWTRFTPKPLKVVDGLFRDPDVAGWDTVAGGAPEAIRIEQAG